MVATAAGNGFLAIDLNPLPMRISSSSTTHRTRTASIGWVVDVQNDFMLKALPGGRLYVHELSNPDDAGAEQIIPNLSRAVALLQATCDQVTYTGDWHHKDDPEIDPATPNPADGTYPPHCMGMSDDPIERAGAALIPEVQPAHDPVILARDVVGDEAREVAYEAVKGRRSTFIQKHQFSVFTGAPGVEAYLDGLAEALDAELEIVMCGVATDVCVKHALDGFLSRNYRIIVLKDAIYGLGLEAEAALFTAWEEGGVEMLTTEEYLARQSRFRN